jgi:hypothetical protein
VTLPPASGAVLDFAGSACSASWRSGAGALPCPGTEGDIRGFALPISNPRLENGVTSSANALILVPQNRYDGYIQGTYPEIIIQNGDHFQAVVGCAYGSACYVTFRLDYLTESGLQVRYGTWAERNEGLTYFVDKDLSALAGQKVRLILMLLATGYATNDRAIWSQPRIVRASTLPPTPTATPIQQSTVTAVNATVLPIYDFNTFGVIGTLSCSEIVNYPWRQEACNGESGGCWISLTPLFGNSRAGFFRHDGNTICGLQLP